MKQYQIGIILLDDEYIVGLANRKYWLEDGEVYSSSYGVYLGSVGLGWAVFPNGM